MNDIIFFVVDLVAIMIALPALFLAVFQIWVCVHNYRHPAHRRASAWELVRHISGIILQDLSVDIDELRL